MEDSHLKNPFPIAVDFSVPRKTREYTPRTPNVLDFFSRVDGGRVKNLKLSQLEELSPSNYPKILRTCPNIRVLKIKGCNMTNEDAQRIPEFCPRIEVLSLRGNIDLTDYSFLFKLKYLKELNLKGCKNSFSLPEDFSFEEFLKSCNGLPLKRIYFPISVDPRVIKNLDVLFPQLEALLNLPRIDEEALPCLPNLVTDMSFRNYGNLFRYMGLITKQCSKLKKLDLYATRISDEDLQILLENCKELEWLILDLSLITNSGLNMLGRYRSLKVRHFSYLWN